MSYRRSREDVGRTRCATTSVLAGEPRHPRPHVAHDRLELGVGALPEVHEAAVVLERLAPVAARLVQLAQRLESWGEAVGVVDDVEEAAEHPRRRNDPLVYRERRVGLPPLIVDAGELEPAAARAAVFVFVVPRAVSGDGVPGSTLGERDVRGGGMTERDAAA